VRKLLLWIRSSYTAHHSGLQIWRNITAWLKQALVWLMVSLMALAQGQADPAGWFLTACILGLVACTALAAIASPFVLQDLASQTLPRRVAAGARLCALGLLLFVGALPGRGQDPMDPTFETGTKLYRSYHGGQIDQNSLLQGGTTVDIPLITYPQRGKLKLQYVLHYRNQGLYADNSCGQAGCQSVPSGYLNGMTVIEVGAGVSGGVSCPSLVSAKPSYSCNAIVSEPDGANHLMQPIGQTTWQAVDASGYRLDTAPGSLPGSSTFYVTEPNGTRYSFGGASSTTQVVEDVHGNQITINGAPGFASSWVDSVGRTIPAWASAYQTAFNAYSSGSAGDISGCTGPLPIAFAFTWNPPGLNGGTYPIKFCMAAVTETFPPLPNPPATGPTSYTVWNIQSLIPPDGYAWTFQYTNDGHNDLSQITFPTGGTLSYTWTSPPALSNSHPFIFTRGIATRTLNPNDGVNPSGTWSYNYGVNGNTTVVTDPAKNDTTHTFGPLGSGTSSMYETLTKSYQGSYSSGSLKKTVQTDYGFGSVLQCASFAPQSNIVPIRVTTTWANGLQSKIERDYDSGFTFYTCSDFDNQGNFNRGTAQTGSYGRMTAMREFDLGQGAPSALIRTTAMAHLSLSTVGASYLANNLLDLLSSDVVSDSTGNVAASTSYSYDEGTPAASNISTQHDSSPFSGAARGNMTSVSRWLNTSSTPLVSSYKWYDTGEMFQEKDALGNITTHGYDAAYAGAYRTMTCNALSQCVSATYDLNTGLQTSFTNANASTQASGNTAGDSAHTTGYAYDSALRITKITAPPDPGNGSAAAVTSLAYSAANTLPVSVQRQRSITSGLNDQLTTYLDGLGRVDQTRHVAPGCTEVVDTVYDARGHTASVSNPYCLGSSHASDPTYGVTQMQYDAIDREASVTKQDGSVSTMLYDQTSTVSANGTCTTVTDEADNPRKSCVDGLGRLIEVDEPGDGSAGTQANGSLSINGTLLGNPATSSTGSVTVTSSTGEQCDLSVCQAGSVSISFNNGAETDSASYGSGDSTSTVAANLASAINNCGHSPCYATATSSGATVTFTSTGKGAGANWPVASSYNAPAPSAFWSTGTVQTPNSKTASPGCLGSTLTAGQNLLLGQCLNSADGRFVLALGTDGNLVLYDDTPDPNPWTVLWSTGTNGRGVDHGYMQSQGNFVLYEGSTAAIWSSPSGSVGAYYLIVQNDGNVVIYSGFPQPSFTITPSQQTMSGGKDATPGNTLYDSGTVTMSLGASFTASAPYGQNSNSTAAQVAAALAGTGPTGLNRPGSPVSATNNGASITLTYKRVGSAGNVNATVTSSPDNPSSFPGGSFSGSTALSGGSDPSLAQPFVTLYAYDTLGNLTCVEQHGDVASGTGCSAVPSSDATSPWRVRRFSYDSLSRLLTAHNSESGTISYQYDADGNLLQKTSPAPNQTGTATQTISYCYDALNRETGRAYSAQSCSNGLLPSGTAAVSYAYDQGGAAANAIGHMTSWSDQAGTGSYTFDVLGRMAGETRSINGVSKSLSYGYNLDGSMKTLTYPSGAVITYTPDTAGRDLSAVDNANAINYVTGASYGPHGSITGLVSGNSASFAGITNSFSYNQRLQPVNMSAASPSATVFSLNYDFRSGNGNNGNVFGIVNNKDNSRNQTFTYDALNRLISAQNAGTDCTKTLPGGKTEYWGNNYSYDSWGNLLAKSVSKCSAENLSLTALANNQLSGYGYDAAGNMTHDATSGFNYSYDQENRIAGAGGFAYTYDAEGNRVEKSNGSTGTLYWYMAPGIVAESDLSGNLQSEYVFFDSERVARRDLPSNAVFYYFSDRLKTTNVVTDAQGNIKNESDFYPWGGELQFLANDSNHYKFNGKERDNETQLDYFGARYYSNGLGRYVTPDWAAKPITVPYANFGNPQTLNLYSYSKNNPTTFGDPDGHCAEAISCTIEFGTVGSFLGGPVGTVVGALAGAAIGGTIGYFAVKAIRSHQSKAAATTPQSTPAVPPPPPPPGPGKNQDKQQKQDQLKANKAQGKAFEKKVVNQTKATDSNVAEQVTLKTESGVRTRMDVVSQDASGQIRLQEAKSSDTAPFTSNQAAAHPEIEQSGATVVGEGKPGYPGGTQIPPTRVEVVRPTPQGP
jgi:RHS repeat-associated protein